MTVFFDHHIVPSSDRARAARFYADLLGLPEPRREGPFAALDLGNDVALYVAGWDAQVTPQHYAFLVSEAEFDAFYARLLERGTRPLGRPALPAAAAGQPRRRRPRHLLPRPRRALRRGADGALRRPPDDAHAGLTDVGPDPTAWRLG